MNLSHVPEILNKNIFSRELLFADAITQGSILINLILFTIVINIIYHAIYNFKLNFVIILNYFFHRLFFINNIWDHFQIDMN